APRTKRAAAPVLARRVKRNMAEHTVKAFTEELDALTQEVSRMGGLAEAAVNDSLTAVARRETTLAQSVIERDVKIDAAQRELERVGDLAKNIAKRALILNQAEPITLTRSVERMGKLAAAHLNQVLDAYANRDVQAAIAVWH